MEDKVASIQDEEGIDETQQDPEYIDDDDSDAANLDHIGKLNGKRAKPVTLMVAATLSFILLMVCAPRGVNASGTTLIKAWSIV